MAHLIDPDRYYDRNAAAEAAKAEGLPLSPKSLATMATRGGGPRMRHFGRRVVYRGSDLITWIESRLSASIGSTSEADAA
jgi:hypothetical protein